MATITVDTKKVNAKVKTGKDKGQTIYQSQVLGVNRALKTENKSLGGCIRMIISNAANIGLDKNRLEILKFISKDNDAFKIFKANVRTSKAGNYSPFYVLQTINKGLAKIELENAEAANINAIS